jgi:hypothetical protein
MRGQFTTTTRFGVLREGLPCSVATMPKPDNRAAEASAPILPILNPSSWAGAKGEAGLYARRLFESRDPNAPDPWVALVAVSPNSDEMLPLGPDVLAEVLGRRVSQAEAESLAVQLLHTRMQQDPTLDISVEHDLLTARWEDFAASLLLHSGVCKAMHKKLGASKLLVAIPTRATLFAGKIDQIQTLQLLIAEVTKLVGSQHVLTEAVFMMDDGQLSGMTRLDSPLAGQVLRTVP